ncbi:MAG TPA: hopanoid biosynthesis associated radical SAM protein HpnJ [Thermomicrobiales bacterium]|jgi:hopanoid biosynthesis associated radical SAM protein HpnJ|nr:hopanoid biosynthesis associated radical SAM protein HpnJ [Thermomicrobiales bacterium]
MLKTLLLNPPSFAGFDGGAGSRYQARREIRSFWYPTWLAQPAALIPGSKLLDAPPDNIGVEQALAIAAAHDLIIIHTSTPSLRNDIRFVETLKERRPDAVVGFVGAHVAVLPEETLRACPALDFVARKEFDYTLKEIAEGRPLAEVDGVSYWDRGTGEIVHTRERALTDMDTLPFVVNVYKRDLTIENYYIGYLKHPYVSLYTGRGCHSRCSFCLWPQTIGGHKYRVRSSEHVFEEMKLAQKIFPQVKEFFFDDDTFTDNRPRAEEIARRLKTLGLTWSCNAKANVPYETLRVMRECGLRLLLVGFESGNQQILNGIHKGTRLDRIHEFVKNCKRLGIKIHGTFILGLPGETRETIQQTIAFARELDPYSIQVSLAAPYPGTELYAQALANGWLKQDALLDEHGLQDAVLEYPGLNNAEIFAAVEDFYRKFYMRPQPILRIVREMVVDRRECTRRLREGYEFIRFFAQRGEPAHTG